jgi:hypothetical protein
VATIAAKIKGVENGTGAEKDAAKKEVSAQVCAYEIYAECQDIPTLDLRFWHLVIIHRAPPEHWRELAERMVGG